MALFGKLFEKKVCSICGGEIGLLGNRKLEDGNLCKHCAALLSPWFEERRESTVEQIRAQLEYREANREKVALFRPTLSFGDSTKLLIDEDGGTFVVTSARDLAEANPDVLAFTDVTACDLDIDEDEDELTYRDREGNLKHYEPPRYKYSYNFYVTIGVRNPYFDEIRFRLNSFSVEIDPPRDVPPGPMNRRPGPADRRPGPMDRHPGPADRRPGPIDRHPGPADRRPGPMDRRPGPMDRHPGLADRRPGPMDRHPGPADRRPGPMDRHPGPMDRHPGPMDRHPGPMDRHPGPMDRRPGPANRPPAPGRPPVGRMMGRTNFDPRRDPDYRKYLRMGDEIQDVLLTLRQLARDGAATAYTPRTYITCPCCGEDTIPDSYGCCEYCGEVICE